MARSTFSVLFSVWRMTTAQALFMTVMNINIITTGLAGAILSPVAWLATLALSLQFVATMLATLPASLLMSRFGRRPIFLAGALLSMCAALIQAYAVYSGHFILFCFGSGLLGVGHAIAQFYRYAAADIVVLEDKPKAISLALVGGLVAAILGPEISYRLIGVVDGALYTGCFIGAALVQCLALPILLGMPKLAVAAGINRGRSMSAFLRLPAFRLALCSAALGYAVMSFLMTAAPLQIVNVSLLGEALNARVIQWHVIAMFAPSFFTGSLISRFGIRSIMSAGLVLYLASIIMALSGLQFWYYFATLFFVGLGWNFLYIAGTSLITLVAEPEERGRLQGITDMTVFTAVACASLSAGIIHTIGGWQVMIFVALLPISIIGLGIVMTRANSLP
ncbi:MAG: Riboflavin transporter RfnT [Alphaproteobacteria bacterium UBA4588]|nr:MAG: Riboflavin transporter RfnT [Alphaproteobacteria bacterium UBA4588]